MTARGVNPRVVHRRRRLELQLVGLTAIACVQRETTGAALILPKATNGEGAEEELGKEVSNRYVNSWSTDLNALYHTGRSRSETGNDI